MNNNFYKEKIKKYSNKIFLLKGGGVNDYIPVFDTFCKPESILYKSIIKLLESLKNNKNMKIPIFLLISLFVDIRKINNKKFDGNKIFEYFMNNDEHGNGLDYYNHIKIIDFSNQYNEFGRELLIDDKNTAKLEYLKEIEKGYIKIDNNPKEIKKLEESLKEHNRYKEQYNNDILKINEEIREFKLEQNNQNIELKKLKDKIDKSKTFNTLKDKKNIEKYKIGINLLNLKIDESDNKLKEMLVNLKIIEEKILVIDNKIIIIETEIQKIKEETSNLIDKLNPKTLYIYCCQERIDNSLYNLLDDNISRPLPDNHIFLVTNIYTENNRDGGLDDFIFWLLNISVINMFNNNTTNNFSTLSKLQFKTYDKQKWFDLNKENSIPNIDLSKDPNPNKPIEYQYIKNLFLELKSITYINNFDILSCNTKFKEISSTPPPKSFSTQPLYKRYVTPPLLEKPIITRIFKLEGVAFITFIFEIINIFKIGKPMSNKTIALSRKPPNNLLPTYIRDKKSIVNYDKRYISGLTLVDYCSSEYKFENISLYDLKQRLHEKLICLHFFDILTVYIKFIQNAVNGYCDITIKDEKINCN